MGWWVLGKGYIEYLDEDQEKVEKKFDEIVKKYEGDLLDITRTAGYINFEMGGNKWIDYTPLEELRDWCKKNKLQVQISVNEYIESDGGGFWYEYEDELEDEDN